MNTFGAADVGTAGGLFFVPRGVAVNRTGAGGVPAGTTYVVDSRNQRVQRFSPTGGFVSTWGWNVVVGGETGFEICTVAADCKDGLAGTGAGQFGQRGGQGMAVDQASGHVYVSDQAGASQRIHVFSATGAFYGAFGVGVIDGSGSFQFCTSLTGCGVASGTFSGLGGGFGAAIGGLAVDAAHNVYVADKTNRRVQVFAPTLSGSAVTGVSFVRAFGRDVITSGRPGDLGTTAYEVCTDSADCKQGAAGTGAGNFGGNNASPSDVAVDSAGNLFALDFTNKRIQQFDSAATPITATFGSAALSFAFGTGNLRNIAVDASDDHLYVSGSSSVFALKVSIAELDPAGASVDTHGSDLTTRISNGLAVAPASLGGNLYLSSDDGGQRVYVLNTPPTIDPVTVHTGTTATFSGSVVSGGIDVSYHFEYSPDGVTWASFPTPDADAGTATGTIQVSEDVTGLTGSQPYQVRLVQNRPLGGGSMTSAETTFTTDPAAPAITGTAFADLASTAATLRARVNPQHEPTDYHFEYIDDAGFQANGFANAATTPSADAGAGAPVVVAQHVSGLEPSTTYHFRAVASNATGTTNGPERSFRTLPAGSEDCANAALRTGPSAQLPDCRAYELVTPPDTNGSAPFGNAFGNTAESGGFETSLLSPTSDSALFRLKTTLPGFPGAGAADIYRASRGTAGWTPSSLTPRGDQSEAPLAGGASPDHGYIFWSTTLGEGGSLTIGGSQTRYVRHPDGSFELIGRGSLVDDPRARGRLITPDAGHIVFTSLVQLEPGAPAAVGPGDPANNSDIVGAVYDRTPGGPTRVVSLLPGDVTPAPGTTTSYRGVAADGSAVVFSVDNTMYVRRDNAATVPVATAASPRELAYAGVSPGGDRVFYLQPDSTSINFHIGRIFVFDADTQDTTAITGAGGAQVVNISADGSHLYFVSPEQLDGANGTPGAENLYVWNGSDIRFIAVLQPADVNPSAAGGSDSDFLGAWTRVNGAHKVGASGLAFDPSRTSADGSVFVFESRARLTAYDNAGRNQVYRYDADADSLVCVSCSPTDDPATSDASLQGAWYFDSPTDALSPVASLTSDGEAVFFMSADALVPEDRNSPCPPPANDVHRPACTDVYQWKDGNLSLISSGRASEASLLWAVSSDASDVLFVTADALVPQDPVGGEPSVYDARVGGGFAADQAAPGCVEDACHGDASVPAGLPTVATITFTDLGNAAPSGPPRSSERVSVTRPRPVRGFGAKLRVKAPSAGVVSVSGVSLARARRRLSKAGTVTIPLRLTAKGRRTLMRKGTLRLTLRVGFRPATGPASAATVALTFRRPRAKKASRAAARRAADASHAKTIGRAGR